MEHRHQGPLEMTFEVELDGRTIEFQMIDAGADRYTVTHDRDGERRQIEVRVLSRQEGRMTLSIDNRIHRLFARRTGSGYSVSLKGHVFNLAVCSAKDRGFKGARRGSSSDEVRSQLPGKVIQLLKRKGEEVEAGEGVVVIEAMKMQNEIASPRSGSVVELAVTAGQTVNTGDLLFRID